MYDPYNPYALNNPWAQTLPKVTQPTQQVLRVNGIEGARAFPTAPNSVVALFDENQDLFYFKTTDAANYPTIRTFKFTEVTENPRDERYLTVEEFNKFKEELLNGKQFVSESADK